MTRGWVDQQFTINETRTPAPSRVKPLSDAELLRQLDRDTDISLRDHPQRFKPVAIAQVSYSTRHLDRQNQNGPDDA
jgi:hypothetical protein